MAKLIIAPHMRLQEWVAAEKRYFRDGGLHYEFHDELVSDTGARHRTVSVAASRGHGRTGSGAYGQSVVSLAAG